MRLVIIAHQQGPVERGARGRQSPSSFHKMLEGVPNFHRVIDAEIAKLYGAQTIRHAYYFFPFNGDPLGILAEIYDKWRVIKVLGGFRPDEYERNTPKDGNIDRVIVAQYLPGIRCPV